MATASSTDDEISCSLCLEIFTDPRGLPCGHTFCLTCLQNHIDANTTDDTFMCPNCRDVVGIPDNKQPTSSWASQFKRNLALVDAIGLIKQFKICGDPRATTQQDPNRLVIESSCETIKKFSHFIEHQMTSDIERLQRSVDVSATQTAAQMQRQGDKLISEFTTAVRTELEKSNSELDKCRQSVNNEIVELFIDVNRLIEESKECLKLGENLLRSTSLPDMKRHVSKFSKMQKITADYLATQRPEFPDLAITLVEPEKTGRKTFSAEIGRILRPDVKSIKITHKIYLQTTIFEPEVEINRKSDRLKHEQTINTKLQSDTKCPNLSSILVLEGQDSNKIIVTDFKNKSVKSFSSEHKTVQSLYRTTSGPWYLAKTRDHQVLVTLPEERQLLYLNVQDDIRLVKTVTTKKRYYGITVLPDDNMAVTEGLSGCVHILNQRCGVIRSIPNKMIPNPWHLTVKGDSLVVVSYTTNIITCVSSSGQVMWVSRDSASSASFHLLCDVTCDTEQFAYVCDNGRDAIVQLSRDGEFIRDVITKEDGLKQPVSLCFAQDKLYVAEQNGKIKIFGWRQT
ncbi:tripartite motif-containing protein 5-like isoform X2 [Gigantopelta aegis]|uniref:tripartite motif-containing protein 5-like isoform X2 n=1 Tax=Gigantopelta aegis TaxID=1735272 RepID=UPI001B88934D|nr:tripartite motif-containing protein 5-like isoform X2 [Gigantopelta aegis]